MNMPVDTLADPIAGHAHAILAHIGEDSRRPGLAETPKRFAAALRFLTGGYEAEPEDVVGRGIFEADEWILISLGGLLGGLIGLAQGAFVLAIE